MTTMDKISRLLDKYFEGKTSLKEEEDLRRYFLREDLPESLRQYRAVFNYMSREREALQTANTGLTRRKAFLLRKVWGYAAGVVLLLGISVFLLTRETREEGVSMVYIDGKAYTDVRNMEEQLLHSLQGFSSEESDVLSSQIDILNSFQE